MNVMVSQITCNLTVCSAIYLGLLQRMHYIPRHWPLWGDSTGNRLPLQRTSNAESVPMPRLHYQKHDSMRKTCHRKCVWHSWWRHQMETFSALLALCADNSPVTVEFLSVRRRFDFFCDLGPSKRWISNRDAGDLSRHWNYHDVTVMVVRYVPGNGLVTLGWQNSSLVYVRVRYLEVEALIDITHFTKLSTNKYNVFALFI